MSALRVILVGLGARSRVWRQVLDADPRARIVGLVETDPARLAAALAERPVSVTAGIVVGTSVDPMPQAGTTAAIALTSMRAPGTASPATRAAVTSGGGPPRVSRGAMAA